MFFSNLFIYCDWNIEFEYAAVTLIIVLADIINTQLSVEVIARFLT